LNAGLIQMPPGVADDWDETQSNLEPNPQTRSLSREMDIHPTASKQQHPTKAELGILAFIQAPCFPSTKSYLPASPSIPKN
jgi:hypothetical protein